MKMKKLVTGFLVGAIGLSLVTGCGNDKPAVSDNEIVEETKEIEYTLLWSDEFDGDTLDSSIWNMEQRAPGWTNSELQEYTNSPDNIYLEDGCLVIKAIETEVNGQPYYTSGKVTTLNNQEFTYGRVEVRAKVPEGQGLWPAIWMMPHEGRYGQWPKCGEIDIMEILGNEPNVSYSTIHYGEPHAQQQGKMVLEEGSFASDFHIFVVEWEPGEMRFYTDDVLVLTVNDWFTGSGGKEVAYPAPFDQPFYLQLNLAVGGTWPGNPDETTDFTNAEFVIDYVRVYQQAEYDTNVTKPEKVYREALEDGNYIYNGDLSSEEDYGDMENWSFFTANGGEGSAETKDGAIAVSISNTGSVDYSIQLVQASLPVLTGHTYRVSFDARADEARDFNFAVTGPNEGYIRYLQDTKVNVDSDWQTYTYEFTVSGKDDNNGRVEFNMGNASDATVYITNVRYEDITE